MGLGCAHRLTPARGMTLAEVVLTLGLLATTALTLIGLFTNLLGTASYNSSQTAAYSIAERIAQQAIAAGPPRWGLENSDLTSVEQLQVQDSQQPVDFFCQVVPSRLRTPESTLSLGTLYQVEVTVYWNGSQMSSRSAPGRGRQQVRTERVVYIEE